MNIETQLLPELFARAKSGDAAAQDTLFDRFYPTVQSMVHGRLARDLRTNRPWLTSRFSTGDVVQEVFRSVLKDLGAFQGETEQAFIGYLAMIVRNRLLDAIRFHEAERRDGRRTGSASGSWLLPTDERSPASVAATAEEVARLHRAIAQFSEREQLLLRARFEGNESFKELAEQLGYGSESAARRAFHGAQARLVLMLSDGS